MLPLAPCAAAAAPPPQTPMQIAAALDSAWSKAHGTAELARLYAPKAVVIKSSADEFEPAATFAAAESTLAAQPDVTLTPLSVYEAPAGVIHHVFRTCTTGGRCGNGYFRLEKVGGSWKIATDVWTLTPLGL